jgi:hypothetical protein
MQHDFESRFTGGAFVAAALMLWLGWALLPVHIGTYFQPDDFGRIHEQFRPWIWIYRVHMFGRVIAVIALVALGTMTGSAARVLIWPGIVVAAAGLFVGTVAEAFYYHHGAWGALELAGKNTVEIQAFVDALRVDTEYVTCLTRFGRVFGGVGLILIAWGLVRERTTLPTALAAVLGLVGLASIALTMGLPDHLSWYQPIFHVLCAWLLASGAAILRTGPSGPLSPISGGEGQSEGTTQDTRSLL